jgi:hypothetical protein
MKNSIKILATFISAILITNPVFASEGKTKINIQTMSDGIVKWTLDSPIKAPKTGCKNVIIKYKVVGGPREIIGYFGIIDNSNNDVAGVFIYTGFTVSGIKDKRSGTKKLKICAEPWSDGYQTYAGIKPGTYDAFSETEDYNGNVIGQEYFTIKVK